MTIPIEDILAQPVLKGYRIIRMTEKFLGHFELNGRTIGEIGTDRIGAFVGGTSDEKVADLVARLADVDAPVSIVVAPYSKNLADACFRRIRGTDDCGTRPDVFRSGSLVLALPESLKLITQESIVGRPVAAVWLLDPDCIVHRACGMMRNGYKIANDRPSHITTFRMTHGDGQWVPPLIVISKLLAKSVSTDFLLGPYGLESWWFVDGRTVVVPRPVNQGDHIESLSPECDIHESALVSEEQQPHLQQLGFLT